MPWIAPDVERVDPPSVADERTSLEGWLEFHRATLLWKCQGLTAEQLVQRPVATSKLSLIGLIRHMAEVERIWFRFRFAGEDVEPLFWRADSADAEFDEASIETVPADYAKLSGEVDAVRQTVQGHSLDETFTFGKDHNDRDLRWIYVHMIEEYARHNGHADLIRELVDGSVGD